MAQVNKVLKIDTKFGFATQLNQLDPLLLTELTGQEGISVPFMYELQVVRKHELTELQPEELVGTMVRIGMRKSISASAHGDNEYFHRTGMVQHVEKTSRFNPGGATHNQLFTFKARVVPAFIMLGAEVRYRIFEDQSAYDILKSILDDMKSRLPQGFRYNMEKLKKDDFPRMEYCVQYGESTVAFLSRLMTRFGIWYCYDHDDSGGKLPPIIDAENETMFFGKYPQAPDRFVQFNAMQLTDDDPDEQSIASFQRQYELKVDRVWAGNFNIFDPTKPPIATEELGPNFDLLKPPKKKSKDKSKSESNNQSNSQSDDQTKNRSSADSYSISEEFPRPFDTTDEATKFVDAIDRDDEARVFTVSGGTKNTSFMAGRIVTVQTDDNVYHDEENNGDYLLRMTYIKAYEHAYLTNTNQDILNLFFRDFLFAPFQSAKSIRDFTIAGSNAGLNNYLQNQQSQMFNQIIFGSRANEQNNVIGSNFDANFLGGITQTGITTAITALISSIDKLTDANDGQITITFVGIPKPDDNIFRVPIPEAAVRPITYGPHTAVVIGPHGSTPKNGDHYADALGRVRVRFPWDPGPPKNGEKLPPSWTVAGTTSDYPFSQEKNTCWVRVSEEWAGRHYGTQFLPRIGQEVIVSFLDGDPERPIITGRVYNSAGDKGQTNLPFPDPGLETTTFKTLDDLQTTVKEKLPLSGIKTWSTPTTDADGKPNPTKFQLLRFDDTRDKEQYLVRAQRRLDITAFEKRYESIGSDRHLTVGAVGEDVSTSSATGGGGDGGNYLAKVTAEYHLSVGKARKTLVKKDDNLQVNGSSSELVGGNWSVTVGGPAAASAIAASGSTADGAAAAAEVAAEAVAAGAAPAQATIDVPGPLGTIVLNSGFNISLSVGASSIVLTPAAIFINAMAINLGGPVFGAPPIPPPLPPMLPTPPKDAGAVTPKQPTLADTGDKLTPPSES